jgi:arylsulfatase A-like enzyme
VSNPTANNSTRDNLLSRAAVLLFPNLPALALMVCGFVAEAALSARGQDTIYQHGLPLAALSLLFLAWFWCSTAWAAWGVCATVGKLTESRPVWLRRVAVGALAVPLAVAGFLYLGSWAFRLESGRFANFESFQFAFSHSHWSYFLHTEKSQVGPFAAVLVAMFVALPFFLNWMARHRWTAPAACRAQRNFWLVMTLAWAGLLAVMESDPNWFRAAVKRDVLGQRLNPAATLAAGAVELLNLEPIEPCLRTEELRPIASTPWQPPPAAAANRPSVLLLSIEALRHDVVLLKHQGQEVMPNLNALARAGVHFTRAYAQSTHTDYASVCRESSLFPLRQRRHHFYRKGDPWPKTLIYDLLKPAGYATAMISSEDEIWGGMALFLQSPNLDVFRDGCAMGNQSNTVLAVKANWEDRTWTMGIASVDDSQTADTAVRWIREQAARGKPFYLGMYFGGSHFPYVMPPEIPRPFQPCAMDFPTSFMGFPAEKADVVRNAYYNSLRECDRQLGRLVAALRDAGRLENTILVVQGDHGEAFHESGRVLHANDPVEPEIHIACVMHAPAYLKPRTEDYPIEVVDFAPTVLGLMGWPTHPNFQGINVLAADRPPPDQRLLFFHTENPVTRTDSCLLAGRWKFVSYRFTGQEALFDLAVSPTELAKDNLLAREPALAARLRAALRAWRSRQLAYYHFPFYYQHYYPPRPPAWVPAP